MKEGKGEEIVGDREKRCDGEDGAGASRETGEGAAELTREKRQRVGEKLQSLKMCMIIK